MGTTIFVAVLALVAVVAIALAFLAKRASRGEAAWPYISKKPLSQVEQVLYHRLVKALPEHMVLAQVQASRVIGVKAQATDFAVWHNRINQLSIDFVICAKDATVVAAIELDDASHHSARRQEADRRKQKALEAAGIRLLRWSVKSLPGESAIRAAVLPDPSAKLAA